MTPHRNKSSKPLAPSVVLEDQEPGPMTQNFSQDEKAQDAQKDVIEVLSDEEQKAVIARGSSDLLQKTPHKKDPLQLYLQEIARYNLLSQDEEQELTKELKETGDIEIARTLVKANLRLVVKIALEYRHAYQNILDLIQEGNIGLMKAVSLYDPEKGAKLSYYASWWIKSYILKFLLDNFRLVKIGTTADQKKLFYNLSKERDRLEAMGIEATHEVIAENLGVSEKAVALMDQRLSPSGGEVSLETPVGDEGNSTLVDLLGSEEESIEDTLAHAQGLEILTDKLQGFVKKLRPRDRDIFQKRLLEEVPPSLQSIANTYGVSRERIRQIEERLLGKLKEYMSDSFDGLGD